MICGPICCYLMMVTVVGPCSVALPALPFSSCGLFCLECSAESPACAPAHGLSAASPLVLVDPLISGIFPCLLGCVGRVYFVMERLFKDLVVCGLCRQRFTENVRRQQALSRCHFLVRSFVFPFSGMKGVILISFVLFVSTVMIERCLFWCCMPFSGACDHSACPCRLVRFRNTMLSSLMCSMLAFTSR